MKIFNLFVLYRSNIHFGKSVYPDIHFSIFVFAVNKLHPPISFQKPSITFAFYNSLITSVMERVII